MENTHMRKKEKCVANEKYRKKKKKELPTGGPQRALQASAPTLRPKIRSKIRSQLISP